MAEQSYKWTDNPTESGVSICDTDVLNDCLMHLKYEKKDTGGGLGFNLFDIKISDHKLIAEEAIGWALQGSLITMTYPDAVKKIKALYADAVDTSYRGIDCKQSIDGRYIADISSSTNIDILYATTGIADFYILDSANSQFYLPKSRWFNQLAVDSSLVNNFNEAGLPNIRGSLTACSFNTNLGKIDATDAFKATSVGNDGHSGGGGTSNSWAKYVLEASLSNLIYGKSETVQPPSSNKLLYYKVGNTVVNESLIDVGQVLSELNLFDNKKADIDLSNSLPSQAFKDLSISWAAPDYSRTISGVGNNYTAPMDGTYWFTIINNNASRKININGIDFINNINSYGANGGKNIQLAKGDKIYIDSPTAGLVNSFFVPSKGAN